MWFYEYFTKQRNSDLKKFTKWKNNSNKYIYSSLYIIYGNLNFYNWYNNKLNF